MLTLSKLIENMYSTLYVDDLSWFILIYPWEIILGGKKDKNSSQNSYFSVIRKLYSLSE